MKVCKRIEKEEYKQAIREIENDQQFQRFCMAFTWSSIKKGSLTTFNHEDIQSPPELMYFKNCFYKQKESIKKFQRQFSELYDKLLNTEKLDRQLLLAKCYKICYESRDNRYDLAKIHINMHEKDQAKISQSIGNYKLPKCEGLSLISVHQKPELTKSIMRRSFPEKVESFRFNNREADWSNPKKVNIGRYLKELAQALPKVTQKVSFRYFEINPPQFKKLLYLCRDKESVEFESCKIHLQEVPNLVKALEGCKIQTLNFYACGMSKYGDWVNNQHHLDNLINGLSQCDDLQNSLKGLSLDGNDMSKGAFRTVFEKYSFRNISFEERYN
ncbi:unnamed protein product [Moneuplotes crassus]|uniref:Uncharacterized protein n=1 Tax=Euplotes crassus TaxID=5936 RepID=A0AAD1U612_EUPCR|nr:unnamed protein product [Moneuplotes crassus]